MTRAINSLVKSKGAAGNGRGAARSVSKRWLRIILRLRTRSERNRSQAPRSRNRGSAHAQRFINGSLEAEVRLLDVVVLIGATGGIGRRLHAIAGRQRAIVLRKLDLASFSRTAGHAANNDSSA